MTKQEFGKLAAAIRTYYPKEQILPNQQAIELWYSHLKDMPYNLACAVLNKWVSENKWSPTIADIKQTAREVQRIKYIEDVERMRISEQIQDTLAYTAICEKGTHGLQEQ